MHLNYIKMISISFLILILVTTACNENRLYDPEIKKYVDELIKERKEKDYSLQFDPGSPFNRDTTISFQPLKYYEPNPEFIFKCKLIQFDVQDTVQILGTR